MTSKIQIQAFVDVGDDKFMAVEDIKKDFDKRQKALKNLRKQKTELYNQLSLIKSTINFIESDTLNLVE